MSERLVRVERFEELRAYDVIRIIPCAWCGLSHRGWLFTLDVEPVHDPSFNRRVAPAWKFLPMLLCEDQPTVVTGRTVARGCVFKVVLDGLASPADQAVSTPAGQPAKEMSDVR